jgi:hypothetical protein
VALSPDIFFVGAIIGEGALQNKDKPCPKSLGLTVSPSLLARADDVVE